jgi:hypothetical protein
LNTTQCCWQPTIWTPEKRTVLYKTVKLLKQMVGVQVRVKAVDEQDDVEDDGGAGLPASNDRFSLHLF